MPWIYMRPQWKGTSRSTGLFLFRNLIVGHTSRSIGWSTTPYQNFNQPNRIYFVAQNSLTFSGLGGDPFIPIICCSVPSLNSRYVGHLLLWLATTFRDSEDQIRSWLPFQYQCFRLRNSEPHAPLCKSHHTMTTQPEHLTWKTQKLKQFSKTKTDSFMNFPMFFISKISGLTPSPFLHRTHTFPVKRCYKSPPTHLTQRTPVMVLQSGSRPGGEV